METVYLLVCASPMPPCCRHWPVKDKDGYPEWTVSYSAGAWQIDLWDGLVPALNFAEQPWVSELGAF